MVYLLHPSQVVYKIQIFFLKLSSLETYHRKSQHRGEWTQQLFAFPRRSGGPRPCQSQTSNGHGCSGSQGAGNPTGKGHSSEPEDINRATHTRRKIRTVWVPGRVHTGLSAVPHITRGSLTLPICKRSALGRAGTWRVTVCFSFLMTYEIWHSWRLHNL